MWRKVSQEAREEQFSVSRKCFWYQIPWGAQGKQKELPGPAPGAPRFHSVGSGTKSLLSTSPMDPGHGWT